MYKPFFCFIWLLAGGAALAQRSEPLNPNFEEKAWAEQKSQLPAYPKDAELKEVGVGPVTSFRFFVDPNSIDVGADGVVRFTLVARSQAGASNVSFEGIRCQTEERKMYAVGRADGAWTQARDPRWITLSRQHLNPVYTVLIEDYFCPERIMVANTREAVDAIRNNGHPRGRSKR